MKRLCETCSVEFTVDKRRNPKKKFCSISCANVARVRKPTTNKKIATTIKANSLARYLKKPKLCVICETPITYEKRFVRTSCSSNCNQEIRSRLAAQGVYKVSGSGGYRKGSGRGKSGWYKSIWCDSSWELAYVMYHLDNNIPITRCRETFSYVFEDQSRKYTPDFVVDNKIIEIKGVWTDRERAKIKQCPVDIKIIDEEYIKPYIEHAKNIYGENFIDYYE